MASRMDLHAKLVKIPGVKKAYFQSPGKDKMVYPCIVYSLDEIDVKRADNINYLNTRRYLLQVIDANPDTAIVDYIMTHFKMCDFTRFFVEDNLNHFNITLYY